MTWNLKQQKGLVTRYTHVKYEGPKSYQSKDMANVKFLQTNKQTDNLTNEQTDGSKTICPQSIDEGATLHLSMWGHKKQGLFLKGLKWKTLCEKKKILVTSVLSFSYMVFNSLVSQGHENLRLFSKGSQVSPSRRD